MSKIFVLLPLFFVFLSACGGGSGSGLTNIRILPIKPLSPEQKEELLGIVSEFAEGSDSLKPFNEAGGAGSVSQLTAKSQDLQLLANPTASSIEFEVGSHKCLRTSDASHGSLKTTVNGPSCPLRYELDFNSKKNGATTSFNGKIEFATIKSDLSSLLKIALSGSGTSYYEKSEGSSQSGGNLDIRGSIELKKNGPIEVIMFSNSQSSTSGDVTTSQWDSTIVLKGRRVDAVFGIRGSRQSGDNSDSSTQMTLNGEDLTKGEGQKFLLRLAAAAAAKK